MSRCRILLALGCLCFSATAEAQWLPLTKVSPQFSWWTTGTYPHQQEVYEVYYSVADPIRSTVPAQWYEWAVPLTTTSSTTYWKPSAPTVTDGTVVWPMSYFYRGNLFQSGIGFAAYDPAIGDWQPYLWLDSADAAKGLAVTIADTKSAAGITAWRTSAIGYIAGNYTDSGVVFLAAYDPVLEEFNTWNVDYPGTNQGQGNYWKFSSLLNADGAVCWVSMHLVNGSLSQAFFNAAIYDETAEAWEIGNMTIGANWVGGTLSVSNGTAKLAISNSSQSLGYNPATRAWVINGSTQPRASFTAKPTSGKPPLAVTFFNSSTAGDTWTWNFGDGTTDSTDRSPIHTYPNAGIYAASLTITFSGGTYTRTQKIVTAVTPPTVTVTSPANGSTVSGAPKFSGSAAAIGQNNSIASVSATLLRGQDGYYWNGSSWTHVGQGQTPPTLTAALTGSTWTLSGGPTLKQITAGGYSLSMTAVDLAGNTGSATSKFTYKA